MLSNAYLILRPFFRAKDSPVSDDPLDPANWELGKRSAEENLSSGSPT